MDLTSCVGIIYGPMTSTFQRCSALEDAPWCCFSLLFPDRTLDLAVAGDAVAQWFLGLQQLLLERSPGCVTCLSEAQFVFRRVQHKLRHALGAGGGELPDRPQFGPMSPPDRSVTQIGPKSPWIRSRSPPPPDQPRRWAAPNHRLGAAPWGGPRSTPMQPQSGHTSIPAPGQIAHLVPDPPS